MSGIQEIEQAIGRLSPQELEELQSWMDERFSQPIDQQLVADLDAGKMDARIEKVLADHHAGRTRTL